MTQTLPQRNPQTGRVKKPRNSTVIQPIFVEEEHRRQLLDSGATPYLQLPSFIFKPVIGQDISKMRDSLQSPRASLTMQSGRIGVGSIDRFLASRIDDVLKLIIEPGLTPLKFLLYLIDEGFRFTNEDLAYIVKTDISSKRSHHIDNKYHHYGNRLLNGSMPHSIAASINLLFYLQANPAAVDILRHHKSNLFLDVKNQRNPISRFDSNEETFMSPNGFDMQGLRVCYQPHYIGKTSDGLLKNPGMVYAEGSPSPSLLPLTLYYLPHLMTSGDDGYPIFKTEDWTCVSFFTSLLLSGEDIAEHEIELWVKFSEVDGRFILEHNYMSRNERSLINDEAPHRYRTRTGILKERPDYKPYHPKHELPPVYYAAKDGYSQVQSFSRNNHHSTIISKDTWEHPSLRFTGIHHYYFNLFDHVDPQSISPVTVADANSEPFYNEWQSRILDWVLDQRIPYLFPSILFRTQRVPTMVQAIEHVLVEDFDVSDGYDLKITSAINNTHASPNSFDYDTIKSFLLYQKDNPAIEQVLKDPRLRVHGRHMAKNLLFLANPEAKRSLDAVGLTKQQIQTIEEFQAIRKEMKPQILNAYNQNNPQDQPLRLRQRGRFNNQGVYVHNGFSERSFYTKNAFDTLRFYFENIEGPGQSLHKAFRDFMEYLQEATPANPPDIISILEACQVNHQGDNAMVHVRIRLSQYVNYMRHAVQYQALPFREFHSIFQDYLTMKIQLHNHADFDYFPRPSIRLAHDIALRDYNLIQREFETKKFIKQVARYSSLYTYDDKDSPYVVIAPKTPNEVVEEGKNLSHCVGSYTSRISDGKTYIMFLRERENPDMSFYTVEINHQNKIIQIEGSTGQRRPKDDVSAFVQKYRQYLSRLSQTPSSLEL